MKFFGKGTKPGSKQIETIELNLREPVGKDVILKTEYCGLCHSDIHAAKGDWGPFKDHCVPGHEIVGVIHSVGPEVKNLKVGQRVGVGCMKNSCLSCGSCEANIEQYCRSATLTYNSLDHVDGHNSTGGYGEYVLAHEHFVFPLSDGIKPELVGPLLCAGITTYAPLMRAGASEGKKTVGVIGLGGLGHMAVKWAAAWGCEVIGFTRKESRKSADAQAFGASRIVISSDPKALADASNSCDIIIDTVGKNTTHVHLDCVRPFGTYIIVGLIDSNGTTLPTLAVIKSISVVGSLIGGIKLTKQMLADAERLSVYPQIEIINKDQIEETWSRMIAGEVYYRPVLKY